MSISENANKKRRQWSILHIFNWSINTVIRSDISACCAKLWIKKAWKVSSFHFIFHSIPFSVTLRLLRRLWAPHPMKNLIDFFFPLLAICLQSKSKCDPVIRPGNICDHRILQFDYLKAFPSITQEQEYPQIWDL